MGAACGRRALQWAVYVVEGRTVGEDGEQAWAPEKGRRGSEGGGKQGLWKDEPRGRRRRGHAGRGQSFDRDDGIETKSILNKG